MSITRNELLHWKLLLGGVLERIDIELGVKQGVQGEDTLTTWMDERCVQRSDAWASRNELFSSWKRWAEAACEHVGTVKQFLAAMRSAGFEEGKDKEGILRGFRGIKPKPFSMPKPESGLIDEDVNDLTASLEKHFGRSKAPGPFMISATCVQSILKLDFEKEISPNKYGPVLRDMGFSSRTEQKPGGGAHRVWRRNY